MMTIGQRGNPPRLRGQICIDFYPAWVIKEDDQAHQVCWFLSAPGRTPWRRRSARCGWCWGHLWRAGRTSPTGRRSGVGTATECPGPSAWPGRPAFIGSKVMRGRFVYCSFGFPCLYKSLTLNPIRPFCLWSLNSTMFSNLGTKR